MDERTIPILPLPEIIDAEDWEIRESPDGRMAYVDFDKKEMCVPFDAGARNELLRAHEAMHVAITPQDKLKGLAGVQNRTVQALEDARVNFALKKAKIDNSDTQVWGPEEYAQLDSPMMTPLEAARADAATRLTGDNEPIRRANDANFPGLSEEVDKLYKNTFGGTEIPTWDDVIKISKEFESNFFDWEPEPEYKEGDGEGDPNGGEEMEAEGGGSSDSEGEGEGEAKESKSKGKDGKSKPKESKPTDGEGTEDSKPKPDKPKRERPKDTPDIDPRKPFKPGADSATAPVYDPDLPSMTAREQKAADKAGIKYWGDEDRGVDPGTLNIEMPNRTKQYRPKKNRKRAAVEAGCVPKYLHRYTSDMRVFGEKRLKSNSTAVLVDVSASMSLKREDIDFILEECPSSVIATYSGAGREGWLTVIAENRMMVDNPLMNQRGANVVDVPALEWLAKRKETRKLWISDGCVTGANDGQLHPKWIRKATNIVLKAKIIRVNHLNDLKKDNLLRFDAKEFMHYQAGELITEDGYDINGWGCGVCDAPNCNWWANYKRDWLARHAND